ncbi:MAG: hypothetical protein JWL72_909, partial [Ilumatobacteraceae bacterium]|nr:hypothetical protein [Ilumatobacteraceae bacterium]
MSMSAPVNDCWIDPRAVLDGVADLVFVLGADGALLDINDTASKLLGWPRAAWLGRSVLDLVHPDDAAMAISSIAALQDKQVGTPIELRVGDSTGGWHWMEVIGTNHLREDGLSGLLCVARDITQRRMWEVAGNDTARLQQIVQHAPSITMLLDADGVVSSVNVAFTRMLGHDPSVVVGSPLAEFVDPRSLADLEATLLSAKGS